MPKLGNWLRVWSLETMPDMASYYSVLGLPNAWHRFLTPCLASKSNHTPYLQSIAQLWHLSLQFISNSSRLLCDRFGAWFPVISFLTPVVSSSLIPSILDPEVEIHECSHIGNNTGWCTMIRQSQGCSSTGCTRPQQGRLLLLDREVL